MTIKTLLKNRKKRILFDNRNGSLYFYGSHFRFNSRVRVFIYLYDNYIVHKKISCCYYKG